MKKLWLAIPACIFFVIFIVFTFVVRNDLLNSLDFDTTVRLQNHIPKKFDGFLSSLSLIGSFEILAGIIFLIVVFRKKFHSLFVFIPFALAHVIEIIGKVLLHHPGPPYLFFRYNLDFLFPSSYIQPGSSYPSGHSLRVVFISVIIVHLIKKSKLKSAMKILLISFLLVFNVLMLVSRVSLGEHWTTDVVGGALLGLSSGIFALIFL
ncbi:Phosphatidic acid phosphatase domain-containing protein, PAP2 family [Candidatus Roizmanbacteria bacterium]|nr:Phosphatidic acid phosphatase domain-containing protein, PAP2 family [Candidatus Roizmanbacteria bacterium]